MIFINSLSPSHRCCFHILLLSAVSGFILGCSEQAPPLPKTMLATSKPTSTALPTPSTVAKPEKQSKNLILRKLDSDKIRRGKVVYQTNCATCHGSNGESTPGWRNKGPNGKYPPPPLNGSAHTWHHSTETLEKMIREGSPPGMGGMPAWENKLTTQEIDDVIVWITSLWPEEIYSIWYKEIEQKNQKKKHHK